MDLLDSINILKNILEELTLFLFANLKSNRLLISSISPSNLLNINTIVLSFKTYAYENHKNYVITSRPFMYI